MVVDLICFFEELDLLEIRLNTYDKLVDKFILIDANQTFAGDPHTPLHPEQMERFAKWKDKMEYYVVEDYPNDKELMAITLKNSNIGAGEHYWVREFYIKESAKKALTRLNDEDIVFVSDIDEFWRPELFNELTDFTKGEFIRPKQQAVYYYFNNFCSEVNGWTGTVVCQYKSIKDRCLNDIRTRSKTKCYEVDKGGWHFGFIVGLDGKFNKMQNRPHPEYTQWLSNFEKSVKEGKDYRGRGYIYWKGEDLPDYIKQEKWTQFLL